MKLENNELQQFKKLPLGWEIFKLGEILPISYGKGLRKDSRVETGKYPVYGSSGKVGNHSESYTSKPCLIIGRKGSVGQIYYSELPCWPIDTVYFFEDDGNVNLKYFKYLLKGLNLAKLDKSTAVPGLSRDDYNAIDVVIAPKENQQSIVTEIEKQFSRLDEAVENLKRVKLNLKKYKASVLKAAVEGKLTEEWRKVNPDVEPADKLIDRILFERRKKWEEAELEKMKAKGKLPKDDKWKKKYKEPPEPDTYSLFSLPKNWKWSCLGQVLHYIQAGKSFKCDERPPEGGETGVVKVSAVTWGEFNELESKTVTSVEKINDNYLINNGDFLFSRANTIELVGACVIVKPFKRNLMLSDKILRFEFVNDFKKWCLICLRTRFGRHEIENLATGNQNSMRNISQTNIFKIRIPLPPFEEQQEIIQETERQMVIIQKIEVEIENKLTHVDRLRQSILKKAFSGQLVSATDEYDKEISNEMLMAAEEKLPYSVEFNKQN